MTRNLQRLLGARKSAPDPESRKPPLGADGLARLERHAPPGYNGCGRIAPFQLQQHLGWIPSMFLMLEWLQEAESESD